MVIGLRHPSKHLRGSAIQAFRSEGVQVDVLGEDLQSDVVEVLYIYLCFNFIFYLNAYEYACAFILDCISWLCYLCFLL